MAVAGAPQETTPPEWGVTGERPSPVLPGGRTRWGHALTFL